MVSRQIPLDCGLDAVKMGQDRSGGGPKRDRGGQKARTGLLLAPGVSGGATRITLSPRAAQLVLHKRVVGRGRASQCDEHKRKLSTAHVPST